MCGEHAGTPTVTGYRARHDPLVELDEGGFHQHSLRASAAWRRKPGPARCTGGEVAESVLKRRRPVGEEPEAQYPRALEGGVSQERDERAQTDALTPTGVAEAASGVSALRRLNGSWKGSGDMRVPSLCSKY
jgi:hypothetical protein